MRRFREEEGQGIVELAIILPFFLVLVLGIIQFGSFYGDYQTITDATRVAARTASICVNGTVAPSTAGTNAASGLSGVTFTYSWAPPPPSSAFVVVPDPNIGSTAPGCKNAAGTAIAPGDQIKVTGASSTHSIKLVFYSFNLTPKSTTTVIVQ